MSTTRLHPHHSLPAPVVHAGFSVSQSKSHVLAGVQDAYWSDDETEDAECPLCLEEMDISDLNFKPCICGYQICRFCWHHIKENLNKRCPACRRIYTDDTVEFKPIATQDHKRLMQQKKQRDRERKELESLGRRHLANVRVVQRNVVYVVGIGPRFAKEELIPTLRSNEYFGQYGKITKILLVKRSSPGGGGPVVGLYITYHRREDAARAITAVDGASSPGGGREVMRASYGTTKYCMAFLRGVSCSDHSCMNLHEWGDEKDCFTKEDLTTLKHTMKATESRTRTITTKKGDEDLPLPRAASWGQKGPNNSSAAAGSSSSATGNAASRQSRRMGNTRQPRNVASTIGHSEPRYSQGKSILERKLATSSVSRPSTPATSEASRAETSNDPKTKQKEVRTPAPQAVDSPAASTSNLDLGSTVPETLPPERPESTDSSELKPQPTTSKPTASNALSPPPGLPAPPSLSAPPGISSPSRPPRAETASPQTPLLASQSSYQMSTAARALLDDVKARRESTLPLAPAFSPFPDFDRTLQTLSGDDGGGFSFNLDPKLADEADSTAALEFEVTSSAPFHGSYLDAFPALRSGSPYVTSPSVGHGHSPHPSIYDPALLRPSSGQQSEKQTSRGPAYSGSFNPFSDATVESTASSSPQRMPSSPVDEERKVSRFGFARGRQSSTAASSPLHSVSPLAYSGDHHNFYNPTEEPAANALRAWSQNPHAPDSLSGSPLSQPAPVRTHFQQPQQNRLQPATNELSEAQLRNFIISSQERTNGLRGSISRPSNICLHSLSKILPLCPPRFSAPTNDQVFASMAYGPPPGLSGPQRPTPPPMMHTQVANVAVDGRNNSAHVSAWTSTTAATLLSPEDFPALVPSSPDPPVAANTQDSNLSAPSAVAEKDQEKTERKATRKAAAVEKALEKQKLAQGKAEAKAAEKAKVARDKQSEKEKAEKEKASGSRSVPTTEDTRAVEPVLKPSVAVPSKLTKKPSRQESQNEKPTTSNKTPPKTSNSSPVDKRQDLFFSPARTKSAPPTKSINSPVDDITAQVPLLSKKPKKNKPIIKPVKIVKEEETHEEPLPSVGDTGRPHGPTTTSSSANSRSHSVDRHQAPTSVHRLLEQIEAMTPGLDLCNHSFFDIQRLTSPAKVPLEYGPLVHALSALSVGGGSFANNMPSGSIDNAVSSFQQLLETLTQTISDLLRLLPRTTWDDSSSFDGVLRDMLKGDDFLDDGGEDGSGKEDEVAALTLALERRARWMEVQLSKLEELHRDINTAAVRAVLSFNDSGWDRSGFLPCIGNTLNRFNSIGMIVEDGEMRPMTADELQKKLAVAQEAAVFAETELREAMEKYHNFKN
ncbi:hypothetical protein NLJ89_g943 [Agrocybe chaxingu]|uniref:RING-type domain-containing protein n=1 Tax=Agrocybe chaxingu TaxID=84603 RepID=A0A9W8N0V2_9AGAR|nr:hypothetical protein NLJ89_g943 [Agrocybe chaxingu]